MGLTLSHSGSLQYKILNNTNRKTFAEACEGMKFSKTNKISQEWHHNATSKINTIFPTMYTKLLYENQPIYTNTLCHIQLLHNAYWQALKTNKGLLYSAFSIQDNSHLSCSVMKLQLFTTCSFSMQINSTIDTNTGFPYSFVPRIGLVSLYAHSHVYSSPKKPEDLV